MEMNYKALDLDAEQIAELDQKLLLHRRYSSIRFRVLDTDDKSITIRVTQGRSFHGQKLDAKKLNAITKEVFQPYVQGKVVHSRVIIHRPSPTDVVTPQWLKQQMNTNGTRNKDMVAAFGIGKAEISAYVNGLRPMSQPVKAMFFYYFASS